MYFIFETDFTCGVKAVKLKTTCTDFEGIYSHLLKMTNDH